MNTDGASRGNPGLAGGGGIIRDHSCVLQYAFSANFGSCTTFRAEIKALEIGLDLAIRMGVKKIMIQMDNVAAVSAISNDEPYGRDCVHVIHSCRNMIKNNDWEVSIFHVYREGNRAADWLANVGVQQNSKFEMIQVPPLELGKIMKT